MSNTSTGKIVASKEVLSREIKGETVLLDLKTEHYFGVHGVGSRIWQLASEGKSLKEMTAVLAAEYEVREETVAQDVERFLGDLAGAGLVTIENADAR